MHRRWGKTNLASREAYRLWRLAEIERARAALHDRLIGKAEPTPVASKAWQP